MNIDSSLKLREYICVRTDMQNNKCWVMNVDNGDVFEINDTAEMILRLCDGHFSLRDILSRFKEKDEHCNLEENDILEFAQYVVNCGICSISDN